MMPSRVTNVPTTNGLIFLVSSSSERRTSCGFSCLVHDRSILRVAQRFGVVKQNNAGCQRERCLGRPNGLPFSCRERCETSSKKTQSRARSGQLQRRVGRIRQLV